MRVAWTKTLSDSAPNLNSKGKIKPKEAVTCVSSFIRWNRLLQKESGLYRTDKFSDWRVEILEMLEVSIVFRIVSVDWYTDNAFKWIQSI